MRVSVCQIRRLVVTVLTVTVAFAAPVSAQKTSKGEVELSKPERAQLQTLSELVDTVMAGTAPAPADVTLKVQHHFVKSAANVYVPYVVEVSSGSLSSFPVGVYVRAVSRSAVAEKDKPVESAFSDIYFLADAKRLRQTGTGAAEFSRGLELPPGEFDLYVAMMETPPRNKSAGPGKRVVHKQAVTVPDFSGGLTTSSIILAKTLDAAPGSLTPRQQLEQPFTIGGYNIGPEFSSRFSKASELLFVFFIYNEAAAANDKPDVDVEYFFFRATEDKPFSKAPTTTFDAKSLPQEFSLSAGHLLVVGQGIPLETFVPGDYKLEIRIADKAAMQNITRDVPFTVIP